MMKRFYRSLCCASVFIFLLGLTHAQAQSQLVTGKITDVSGNPVPGANILIKGSTTGTSADASGSYKIEATASDVLVISFIGYKSKEIPVGTQSVIDVTMEDDISTLQEVVVVGYGVQKKVLNTGANLQVSGENLQKMSTTNALQALQGQAPGVQITSTSGQPGEGMKVLIRGVGSIGGSGPLYVVDGVQTGDITYLNNADIQSIDVLKDAASAAIYGSQASNGVVLITTKKGKSGHSQITFDSYVGVQNLARKAPLLNAKEYALMRNEAAVNSGQAPMYSNAQVDSLGSAGTNWMDKIFVKNAPTRNYSLGASGGNDISVYSTALSYVSQAGIVGGAKLSNYDRYNFRFNSEHKLYKDRVVVGQNLTFSYTDKNGVAVGGQYNNALRPFFQTTPLLVDSPTDTEGMFYQANPYRQTVYNSMNKSNAQKILGNAYIQVEPIKNLTFRSSVGIDYNAGEGNSYLPAYQLSIYSFNLINRASQNMFKNKAMIFDNLVSYGFNKGDHRFDLMAGSTIYRYDGSSINGSNTSVVFDNVNYSYLTNTTNRDGARITLGGGPDNPNRRISYFGRLNYNFKETFLLNATFRADGSSRFAPGHQWGYFPSVSAGWVMTNSAFLSPTQGWLSFLKLRASWGQVGNQNASDYNYLAQVQTATTNYTFGPTEGTNGLVPGAYNRNIANPNLKWETSQQSNIGFDARLFNGKVTANFDVYNKTSKNWLIQAPVLATAGAQAPYINGGNVTNKGIELALIYNNSIGELNYKFGINGAINRNKVTKVPTIDGIIHPASSANQLYDNSPEFYRAQTGFPIGYFWGLKTDGIFQTEQDVLNYKYSDGTLIQPNAKPGDVRYVDRDGQGGITSADKTMIGNPNPKMTFGFTVSADYKGFDFSVLANGVMGNSIVQSYRGVSNPNGNYTTAILNRWHGAGTSNRMPAVTDDNRNWADFSDLYIQKGDFLRISNVTVGYDFAKLYKNKFVSQFRLYFAALNLFTFTRYNGMDPEIGFSPENGNSFASGIDVGYYPRPRTYMVGVNVKF